jgi:hypothetical protein
MTDLETHFALLEHPKAFTKTKVSDHVRRHESPPFQDISPLSWLRRSVLDLANRECGLSSDLGLPSAPHTRIAKCTRK